MDHAEGVQVRHGAADRRQRGDQLAGVQVPPGGHDRRVAAAVDEVEDQRQRAVGEGRRRVQPHDVRVVEAGEDPGLAGGLLHRATGRTRRPRVTPVVGGTGDQLDRDRRPVGVARRGPHRARRAGAEPARHG